MLLIPDESVESNWLEYIPGTDKRYAISKFGEVYSIRQMKTQTEGIYESVKIFVDGEVHHCSVDKLMKAIFEGGKKPKWMKENS